MPPIHPPVSQKVPQTSNSDLTSIAVQVWNPGGDPPALRSAAQAWRDIVNVLQDITGTISTAEARLSEAWSDDARERYLHVRALDRAQGEPQISALLERARWLDQIANDVADTNNTLHVIYAGLAASILVGAAFSVVTLGFSLAADAAEAAIAAAEAGSIVARLVMFLARAARTFAALAQAGQPFFVNVGGQYRAGLMVNAASGGIIHWITAGHPGAGWTAKSVKELGLASTIGAPLGAGMYLPFAKPLLENARWWIPGLAAMGQSAVNGAAYRVVDGIWLRHENVKDALSSGAVYSMFSIALAGVVGAGWSSAARMVRGRSTEQIPSGVWGINYRDRYWWEPTVLKQGVARSVLIGVMGALVPPFSPFTPPPKVLLPPPLTSPIIPPSQLPPFAAPAPHVRPPAPTQPPAVVVQAGDSLSAIAQHVYGNPSRWPLIALANPQLADPNLIHPGEVLVIPPAPPAGSPALLGGGAHVVRAGETLTAIARQAYGDPTLWPMIAQANHLANPNLILIGQVLDVPAIVLPEVAPAGS